MQKTDWSNTLIAEDEAPIYYPTPTSLQRSWRVTCDLKIPPQWQESGSILPLWTFKSPLKAWKSWVKLNTQQLSVREVGVITLQRGWSLSGLSSLRQPSPGGELAERREGGIQENACIKCQISIAGPRGKRFGIMRSFETWIQNGSMFFLRQLNLHDSAEPARSLQSVWKEINPWWVAGEGAMRSLVSGSDGASKTTVVPSWTGGAKLITESQSVCLHLG